MFKQQFLFSLLHKYLSFKKQQQLWKQQQNGF